MTLTHGDAYPRSSNDPVIDGLLDTDPSIRCCSCATWESTR